MKTKCECWLLGLLLVVGCTGVAHETAPEASLAPKSSPELSREADGLAALVQKRAERCLPYRPTTASPESMPVTVLLCADVQALEQRLASRDRREPPPANPQQDEAQTRDGLAVYHHAVRFTSRDARIVPLLFFETPPLSGAQRDYLAQNPQAAAARLALTGLAGKRRWRAIRKLISRNANDKVRLRHILLRDGYLFEEDPVVARNLFRGVGLADLFDEQEILLQRGDQVSKLRRTNGRYELTDGPRSGQRARLLIFDRVGISHQDFRNPRAWDLDRLRRAAALRTFLIERNSPDLAAGIATLVNGDQVPAATFDETGNRTLALVVPLHRQQAVTAALDLGRRDQAIALGILAAGERMVDEKLRFDEPRTEVGQQDGALRHPWMQAYMAGKTTYTFNGDTYRVFTAQGDPRVPQVCVDFVLDSAERWSGSWWAPRTQSPSRATGFLDFSQLMTNRRQVRRLIAYAKDNPERLEIYDVPSSLRVPFATRNKFHSAVAQLSGDVLAGDALVIYGLRDDGRNHWHAFYVYQTDPMHGIPIVLMGNAGTARIQVWNDVMRSAPLRQIHHRIRFNTDWLVALRS